MKSKELSCHIDLGKAFLKTECFLQLHHCEIEVWDQNPSSSLADYLAKLSK